MKFITLTCLSLVVALAALANGQDCGMNEKFVQCGSSCPEHCPVKNAQGDILTGPSVCIELCKSGCFCLDGFVRDLKQNNICVERSLCTPP